ncbi:MAG TPA: radical SAM protein, partial [Terriglobia bacterium]|nr:radical SAM protein [Terriglobia bacterium]
VDAIALGEADATWPMIVTDAANGVLKEIYKPLGSDGKEIKPTLQDYPKIPWDTIDLKQFDLIGKMPALARYAIRKAGLPWKSLSVVPMESGRGCPYGCDFCTVTGFFGDSIRFRTDQSVVDEMLMIKARAEKEKGKVAVFFIDDNFAINVKRAKSLMREIIRRDAILPWVAQISINLLRDEELLDLIRASGGHWIFIGLESIDSDNLKDVNKGFNKPAEYAAILQRLSDRGLYAITSFIFGMDGDTPGVAKRTTDVMNTWPPGLPVFGLLTPYPATPLYDRLMKEGRLTRPQHWLDFRPFRMAFTPKSITIEQSEAEVRQAWTNSYSAEAVAAALDKIWDRPFGERAVLMFTRMVFRGIYFPQMTKSDWLRLLFQNWRSILRLAREGYALHRGKKPQVWPAPKLTDSYRSGDA